MHPQSESLEALFVDWELAGLDISHVFSKQNILVNIFPFYIISCDLNIEEIATSFVTVTFYLVQSYQCFQQHKSGLKET